MKTYWNQNEFQMVSQLVSPVAVKDQHEVRYAEKVLITKEPCLSFSLDDMTGLREPGAYIVLDFGKEVCGGIRLITRIVDSGSATLRITLGESVAEACSDIGQKNATNHHSPRDFTALISNLSDLTFGQSGFRFARIELISGAGVWFRSVYAVNNLPWIEKEGTLTTDDELLNQIFDTAAYTLKLCCQNGYIWDGIKRDRLVWCGDLHPEIISSMYILGDNANVRNSLRILRKETKDGEWINRIPSYCAWWVVNLCDYCSFSGNEEFFQEGKQFARDILEKFDRETAEDGTIDFKTDSTNNPFFLDWPTAHTEDARIGTAVLIRYAAQKFLKFEECDAAARLVQKLRNYLDMPCKHKCVRAFQILAGRRHADDAAFLEAGGAKGISTFMAYYIFKANVIAGGKKSLEILKDYYGGMLQRGATTFWEDFNIEWLEGSGRIDEIPAEGVRDIHGDYGAFCYSGLRHSLCHGWSSGVLAFIVEEILGLRLADGGKTAYITPDMAGLKDMDASIPVSGGMLHIAIHDGEVKVDAPAEIQVILQSKNG